MAWEMERSQQYSAEHMATPKDLMESLLDAYSNFREEKITDTERDLTQQEEAEIKTVPYAPHLCSGRGDGMHTQCECCLSVRKH